MKSPCRLATFVSVLLFTAPAPAQQDLKQFFDNWEQKVNEINRKQELEFDSLRKQLQKTEELLQPFWLRIEADQYQKENRFVEAAQTLERGLQSFEKKGFNQLTFVELETYRDSLLQLGLIYATKGNLQEASARAMRAWEAHERMLVVAAPGRGPSPQDTMRAAIGVAAVLQASGRLPEAMDFVNRTRKAARDLKEPLNQPEGNSTLLDALLLESQLAHGTRDFQAARASAARAVAVLRQLRPTRTHPDGDLKLAAALVSLALAQLSLGENDAAFDPLNDARIMLGKQGAKGRLLEAETYRLLAHIYLVRGNVTAALDNVKLAWKTFKELFPPATYKQSHPALIEALTSLADLLNQSRQHGKAVEYAAEAREACVRRYGRGPHPQQVSTLLCYGRCLRDSGQLGPAQVQFSQAVGLANELAAADARSGDRSRVANSRLLLATSQIHLGSLFGRQGRYADAHQLFHEAQKIYEESFQGGNSFLFAASAYLGTLALQQGNTRDACEAFREALAIDQRQLQSLARMAGELEALTFAQPRQVALSGYLCATRDALATDGEAFNWVWCAKNAVTRLAEARRRAIRMNEDPRARQLLGELTDVCIRISREFATGQTKPSFSGSARANLLEERERLERALREYWPTAEAPVEQFGEGPEQLAGCLPEGAAFVDFVRYDDFRNPVALGPCYVAFVVLRGEAPRRVDLGIARPIDAAVNGWRRKMMAWDANGPDGDNREKMDQHANELRKSVWEPIQKRLPAETRLLVLAPDGDLARFPFAVLPGSTPDSILLEEYTIAYVQHGQFLLEHLQPKDAAYARSSGFLGLEAIQYGSRRVNVKTPYTDLKPSDNIVDLTKSPFAPRPARILQGNEATVDAMRSILPTVSEAHMATHGAFDESALNEERRKLSEALRNWTPEQTNLLGQVGAGRRYPLAYTWLALSGANQPESAGPSGGILTGEAIAQLQLDGLRCVVLSACDTGLGEYTAGEGVQGLQRAFHLAGCANVVATLWKVGNSPTRDLMSQYYRRLWEKKVPTLEALRQAQLAMYRGSTGGSSKRAHPQLWAAFVHSGLGDPVVTPEYLATITEKDLADSSTPSSNLRFLFTWVGIPALVGIVVLGFFAIRRTRKWA